MLTMVMNGWYIYWGFALAFAALILFAIPEVIAMHRKDGVTFSEFMHNMRRKWPPWEVSWGALIGGLTVHFTGWCVGCIGG